MIFGFTTTYAISAYHNYSCVIESRSWRGVLDTTLCDKVCQWLMTGLLFSPGTPVSSTNKTDRHDITDILLKVALNTIILIRILIEEQATSMCFLINSLITVNIGPNLKWLAWCLFILQLRRLQRQVNQLRQVKLIYSIHIFIDFLVQCSIHTYNASLDDN